MQRQLDPVELSRRLLEDVRTGADVSADREALASLDGDRLAAALDTDDRRIAFWVNVYNAAVQWLLAADRSRYESRWRFFRRDQVPVAGETLSLDAIEHGILRRSKLSWGLGYLPRPFPSAFERTHRVDELDPRIHFALNCGAASCPPIRSYDPAEVDAQLDLATASYLDSTADYDPTEGVVRVSKLFRWYRGDFGGKRGILAFLRRHDAVPPDADPSVGYTDYDWTLDLDRDAGETG